jgi:hypothetical protein
MTDIIDDIQNGMYDHDLDGIEDAVRDRMKYVSTRLFYELVSEQEDPENPSRIRLKNSSRIKGYMRGYEGTVVEKRVSKIVIRFDDDIVDPYNKWAGKQCIISPTAIDLIVDGEVVKL